MKYIALLVLCFLGFAHADLPNILECVRTQMKISQTTGNEYRAGVTDGSTPTADEVLSGKEAWSFLLLHGSTTISMTSYKVPYGLSKKSFYHQYYYRDYDFYTNHIVSNVFDYSECSDAYSCFLKNLSNPDCFGCKSVGAKNYAPEYAFHNESLCEYYPAIDNMPCLEVKNAYLENCNDCNAID